MRASGATTKRGRPRSAVRVSARAAQQLKERGALGDGDLVPPPPPLPPPRAEQTNSKIEEPRSRQPAPSSDLLVSLTAATRRTVQLEAKCAKWEAETSRLRVEVASSAERVAEVEAENRALVDVVQAASALEDERRAACAVVEAVRAEADRERELRRADADAASAVVRNLEAQVAEAVAQYEAAMAIVEKQDAVLRRVVERGRTDEGERTHRVALRRSPRPTNVDIQLCV